MAVFIFLNPAKNNVKISFWLNTINEYSMLLFMQAPDR